MTPSPCLCLLALLCYQATAKPTENQPVAIAKQQNKLLAAIALGLRDTARAMNQLLSSQRCLEPFERFGSMCLHFVKEDKSWTDAERFCNTLGGFLAWISDKNEHLVMSRFAREKTHHLDRKHQWFQIGLFRRSSGAPLEWTSGSESSYRGVRFRKVNQIHFSAKAGTTWIYGDPPKYKGYFLCRLA